MKQFLFFYTRSNTGLCLYIYVLLCIYIHDISIYIYIYIYATATLVLVEVFVVRCYKSSPGACLRAYVTQNLVPNQWYTATIPSTGKLLATVVVSTSV